MPVWVVRVIAAARRVPWVKVWAVVVWLATSGREYWNRLAPKERKELLDLMVKSKGRRSNLSKREQDRVFALLNKVREGK